MKRTLIALGFSLSFCGPLGAVDDLTIDSAVGGAIGGAIGGAVGAELGGRDGAIIGAGLGAATGTAVNTREYADHDHHGDHGHGDQHRQYYRSGKHGYATGTFCPPGQAKKGRC